MTNQIIALYADGGVIGRNPSADGGTWAYCHVDESGQRIREQSGLITPNEAKVITVTNNLTEMIAVVRGLCALPEYWSGIVASDSQITLGRLFWGWKWNNIPRWLINEASEALKHIDAERCTARLLDGHPTVAQLAVGIGKRGSPVSEHNVWCDTACKKQASAYLAVKRREEAA